MIATERQETEKPHQPEEPICNNPAYYELYATYDERMAWLARIEQARNDARYKRLLKDLDINENIL